MAWYGYAGEREEDEPGCDDAVVSDENSSDAAFHTV